MTYTQGILIGGYNAIIDRLLKAVILKQVWIIWKRRIIMTV